MNAAFCLFDNLPPGRSPNACQPNFAKWYGLIGLRKGSINFEVLPKYISLGLKVSFMAAEVSLGF